MNPLKSPPHIICISPTSLNLYASPSRSLAEQCNQKNNLEHTTIEITQPRQYHRPSIIDLLTGGHPPSHPHPPPPIPVATTQAPPPRGLLDQTDNENSHRGKRPGILLIYSTGNSARNSDSLGQKFSYFIKVRLKTHTEVGDR